jgi:N-acylneuraminate cytidylyltransferase/CMP-N,N'-diacetyllegionaminic acid synthase
MHKNKKILAIIPARGGSKGLPGKNIKPLLGKPLIGWTIEQAKASRHIDDIFVSTDSREIADVAETFGIKVPELRPPELAGDAATSASVVIYTIEKLRKEGKSFDYLILLEPTSPLRDIDDIDNSIEILINTPDAESIVGVCKVENAHPSFLASIDSNNFLNSYTDQFKVIRRQDLMNLYFFEGSIYVSKIDSFINCKTFYHDKCMGYIVPKYKSFEIDDLLDFRIVETIMQLKEENKLS